jgi:DNA mismatch endonuclease Vsr
MPYGGAGERAAVPGLSPSSISAHQYESVVPPVRPSVRPVSSLVKSKPVVIRPDFVFPKPKVAVFVDGCFFHGCPKHATWPKNNAAFWRAKIEGNRARDRRQTRLLRAAGWRVIRIWEHALTPKNAVRTRARLRRFLKTSPDSRLKIYGRRS